MYYLYYNGQYYRIIKDLCKFDVEHLTRTNYIKKQSENVFDLIEVGDLVRFNWGHEIGEVTTTQFHNEWKRITVGKRDGVYDENILAIYKPNKKGDYICVWRRENEEH